MVNSGGYEYDESSQVVRLETLPVATVEGSIAVSERLTQDPQISPNAGFLVDLRNMTRLLQFDEIYQVIDWHKARGFPFKGRHAFLVDRPATVGTANIFCTLLQLHAIEADMFDSDQLAHAWLSSGPRTSGEFARGADSGLTADGSPSVDVAANSR